jgi:hypothetical protein
LLCQDQGSYLRLRGAQNWLESCPRSIWGWRSCVGPRLPCRQGCRYKERSICPCRLGCSSLVPPTCRNQMPHCTWGWAPEEQPNHHLPHHPSLRASQPLDRGSGWAHQPTNLQAAWLPRRQFRMAHPHPSLLALWPLGPECGHHQPKSQASCLQGRRFPSQG